MEIRNFNIKDRDPVLQLFELAFGKPIEDSFWKWRYLDNPFFEEQLIDLMWEGDKLVGHYALWPMEFSYDDTVIKSALSMTTMTHPEYGGKGIFTNLAKSVYDRAWNESAIEMIWGFPNSNSHYGFITKLAWKDIGTIPMVSSPWIDDLHDINVPVTPLNQFNDAHAHSIVKNSPLRTILVNKTANYLNWRYNNHPTIKYYPVTTDGLDGFLVLKLIPSFEQKNRLEIDIIEWNVPASKEQTQLAIELMHSFACEMDIRTPFKMNTWLNIHDPRFSFLERMRFNITSPLTFLGKLEVKGGGKFDHLPNWSISLGDSDVF